MPTARLRKLEIMANEAFDTYREMYVVLLLGHGHFSGGFALGTRVTEDLTGITKEESRLSISGTLKTGDLQG
jgi:hypothetical protein